VLQGGERVQYDHLVVATGARARPSPWPTSDGVHVLGTLDDSAALRRDLISRAASLP
jgi:NADPH-dependent 2,4-dienoyl-CoA reductase/sulfur reductase-like enzyme